MGSMYHIGNDNRQMESGIIDQKLQVRNKHVHRLHGVVLRVKEVVDATCGVLSTLTEGLGEVGGHFGELGLVVRHVIQRITQMLDRRYVRKVYRLWQNWNT